MLVSCAKFILCLSLSQSFTMSLKSPLKEVFPDFRILSQSFSLKNQNTPNTSAGLGSGNSDESAQNEPENCKTCFFRKIQNLATPHANLLQLHETTSSCNWNAVL